MFVFLKANTQIQTIRKLNYQMKKPLHFAKLTSTKTHFFFCDLFLLSTLDKWEFSTARKQLFWLSVLPLWSEVPCTVCIAFPIAFWSASIQIWYISSESACNMWLLKKITQSILPLTSNNITYFEGDTISKQNRRSPSVTGFIVQILKSSSITVSDSSPDLLLYNQLGENMTLLVFFHLPVNQFVVVQIKPTAIPSFKSVGSAFKKITFQFRRSIILIGCYTEFWIRN